MVDFMKKRLCSFTTLLIGILLLVGCGSSSPNSNAMDTAKNFTKAQIEKNEKDIRELSKMDVSPEEILKDADETKYYKYKLEEFSFKQISDTQVDVAVPKGFGEPYSLKFTKVNDKYYVSDLGKTKEQEDKVAQQDKERAKQVADAEEKLKKDTEEQMEKDIQQLVGKWEGTVIRGAQKIELTINNIDENGKISATASLSPMPGIRVISGYKPVTSVMKIEGQYTVDMSDTVRSGKIHRKIDFSAIEQQPTVFQRFGFGSQEIYEDDLKAGIIRGGTGLDNQAINNSLHIEKKQ
jgi:hypothetical protein